MSTREVQKEVHFSVFFDREKGKLHFTILDSMKVNFVEKFLTISEPLLLMRNRVLIVEVDLESQCPMTMSLHFFLYL